MCIQKTCIPQMPKSQYFSSRGRTECENVPFFNMFRNGPESVAFLSRLHHPIFQENGLSVQSTPLKHKKALPGNRAVSRSPKFPSGAK
jgi:hypothetical protein